MVDVGVHMMVSNNANFHEERYPLAVRTNWHSIDVDCGCFYASIEVRISANRPRCGSASLNKTSAYQSFDESAIGDDGEQRKP